ncbi:hypothetical protein DIPPA_14664 [Diplonema papillatum]|nr:hypothetical protein DIPPA_14664 [Diplonema papillatum]
MIQEVDYTAKAQPITVEQSQEDAFSLMQDLRTWWDANPSDNTVALQEGPVGVGAVYACRMKMPSGEFADTILYIKLEQATPHTRLLFSVQRNISKAKVGNMTATYTDSGRIELLFEPGHDKHTCKVTYLEHAKMQCYGSPDNSVKQLEVGLSAKMVSAASRLKDAQVAVQGQVVPQ